MILVNLRDYTWNVPIDCIKTMQGIDQRTRSCVALKLLQVLEIPNLESEIMKKKCTLFGQICRLDPYYTVKRIFLHSLTSHYFFNDVKYGFIVDTLRIITDLGLEGCIVNFLNTGVFPSKYVWKKQVRSKLETMTSANVLSELHLENFDRFPSFNSAWKSSLFWWLCRRKPHLLAACKSVVKAISLFFNRYSRSVCSACGAEVDSYVNHRVLWCPVYQTVRQKF